MLAKEFKDCDLYQFKPPHTNGLFIGLVKAIYPLVLQSKYSGFDVEVIGDGIERIKRMPSQRVIICPNHPTHFDPDTLFMFSKLLGENLNFLSAREVMRGPIGKELILQLAGCFSVVRGIPDAPSFKAARDLLVTGRRKIVMFPEGEISGKSDVLLPLKTGAAHVAYAAVDEMRQEDKAESVYILPVALRYHHLGDPASRLQMVMNDIESALGLESSPSASLGLRATRALKIVMNTLLCKYNIEVSDSLSLSEKINLMRDSVLRAIASYVGYDIPVNISQLELAHRLYVRIYELRWYERSLEQKFGSMYHTSRLEVLKEFAHDLRRVINFIAVSDCPVDNDGAPSEDLVLFIELLESEVLSRHSLKGPLKVQIAVGNPIDVLEVSKSRPKKSAVIKTVNRRIGEQLESLLDLLSSSCPPENNPNKWQIQSRVA